MSTGLTPDLGDPEVLARLFAPAVDHAAIGLAVSGGPDSLALMLLARRWVGTLETPPRLIVYSLDHGLRPEAADEVQMVLRESEKLGLTARGLGWTGDKPETGLQEAARQARDQRRDQTAGSWAGTRPSCIWRLKMSRISDSEKR